MEILVLIICAVIIVAGIVLIIWILRNRYDNSNVVIHGGMDTGTQKNGTESGVYLLEFQMNLELLY